MNEALIKWLCHDLATPVATVLTASELLGPDEDQEVRDMVTDGAKRLAARLRLIRAALAPADAAMAGPGLAALVSQGSGAAAVWVGRDDPVPPITAALISGLALVLGGTMLQITGGEIRSEGRPASAAVVAVLGGGTAEPGSKVALASHIAERARAAGLRLEASNDASGTGVRIVAA